MMKNLLASASAAALIFLGSEAGALRVVTTVSGDVSANITVSRSNLGVGPEAITFSVDGWTGFDTVGPGAGEVFDARHRDLIYLWNFDDTGATFAGPVNVLAAWRNANVAYGSRVSHVFGPGTYSPSCLIVEPASGKTATIQVPAFTVADPNSVFAPGETIYVHPTADYSASPATAGTDASNLYDVLNGLKGAGATARRRIVLEGGQTYSWVPTKARHSARRPAAQDSESQRIAHVVTLTCAALENKRSKFFSVCAANSAYSMPKISAPLRAVCAV